MRKFNVSLSSIFLFYSLFLFLIFMTVWIGGTAQAQEADPFKGTFKNELYGTTVVLYPHDGGYKGTLNTGYMTFALSATESNGRLSGKVFHGKGNPVPWSASIQGEQLMVQAYGGQNPYKKVSSSTKGASGSLLSSSEAQRIAGSRLYWYQEASIFATSGGAYGELDFCSDGSFRDYRESSVRVEAGPDNYNREYYDQMGSAGAASVARSSGYWTILNYQGQAYLAVQYTSGATNSAPLSQVLTGTWYVGKTKFAMDWGKGQCR